MLEDIAEELARRGQNDLVGVDRLVAGNQEDVAERVLVEVLAQRRKHLGLLLFLQLLDEDFGAPVDQRRGSHCYSFSCFFTFRLTLSRQTFFRSGSVWVG